MALNQSRRQTLESFTNIQIDQAWYTISVAETERFLRKCFFGGDKSAVPARDRYGNFPKKNLWGKPLGDQRRKAAKVVCFCFHSEVSNPTFWDLVRSHRMGKRRVWSCVKVLQPSTKPVADFISTLKIGYITDDNGKKQARLKMYDPIFKKWGDFPASHVGYRRGTLIH